MTTKLGYTRYTLIQLVAAIRRRCGIRWGNGVIDRYLYPPSLRDTSPFQAVVRYDDVFTIEINSDSWIEWSIFINGYYEFSMVRLLRSILRPNDTALDVGANIGAMTLVMSRLVGAQGRVLAVEPNPVVLNKLNSHLAKNSICNVDVFPVAVSDEPGEALLFSGYARGNEGLGHLWHPGDSSNEQSVPVPVDTLDSIIEHSKVTQIRLLKLDVQGWEYKTLRGSARLLTEYRPYITFEVDYNAEFSNTSFEQIQGYLTSFGYTLYTVEANGRILPVEVLTRQGNFLAVPPDSPIP